MKKPILINLFIILIISLVLMPILEGFNVYASELSTNTPTILKTLSDRDYISSETLLSQKRSISEIYKNQKYVEGEVLVKYREEEISLLRSEGKENIFLEKNGLRKEGEIKSMNMSLLKINEETTVEEVVNKLNQDPSVEFAQPNFVYYTSSIDTNDPDKELLWGLDNTGQSVNGIYGSIDSDMDVPEAWNVFERNENPVIVAVIDTGVAYDHPDLADNMWDGTNCVSDTGSALGGCIHGYDFEGNDKSPLPNSPSTHDSHGTHVAGIISATRNNNIGLLGVAPQAEIMALKVDLTSLQIIKAINFAEENSAKIINASFGGPSYDSAMLQAINNFSGLFITAAGNGDGDSDPEGDNHDSGEIIHGYPCDFTASNIICVAATDQNDDIASFSDYGTTSVDVGAPGVNIFSTVNYDEITFESFENTAINSIPLGWTRILSNNYWGVRDVYGDKFLYGDIYKPYLNNAFTAIKSPSYNLSTTNSAVLYTDLLCDTENYYLGEYTDLMALWYRNGTDDLDLQAQWNEEDIRDLVNYGLTVYESDYGAYIPSFEFAIPEEFLKDQFNFVFSWDTDSSVNNYWGCAVNNISLLKEDPNYDFMNGTSMATPNVVGVASLIWGYRPNLSAADVKDAILNSGDSVASLEGKTVTGKRVNAQSSLLYVQGDVIDTFKFNINDEDYSCFIDEKDKEIICDLPADYPKSNMSPTITLTAGTISPETGVSENFLLPQTYTYTKSDLTEENYSVIINNFFEANTAFRSGPGNWSVPNAKFMTSGDYNGDGNDDIGVMYDYGNSDMALIVFESDGSSLNPDTWFRSGPGNWSVPNAKFVSSADYNNDGRDDIGVMYDYGNRDMGLIVFESDGSSLNPDTWFRSGPGNWSVPNAKFMTSGDYNSNSNGDIGVMYDYGNRDMGLIVFESDGSSLNPDLWFRSGPGNWSVPNARFVSSGDYDGDGLGDMGVMYDYGNSDMGLIVFESDGSSLNADLWFRSGPGNWSVPNAKFVSSGDFNDNGIGEIGIMYDYGNLDMSLIVFK